MTLELYAINDKLNGYIPPVTFPNVGIAKRWFKEMLENNITMKTTPTDFTLWKLGEFNTETGELKSNITRININTENDLLEGSKKE